MEQNVIFRILALVVTSIAIMFLAKKFVESVCNLSILLRKKNYYDVSKQRHGIVYNKKAKKLEADQSLILPF